MSTTLGAATQDRKARLAQLKSKSLKRKEPSPDNQGALVAVPKDDEPADDGDISRTVLSGRNYDPDTRGPKLGFEYAPNADKKTLEQEAAALEEATRQATLEERTNEDGKPLEMDIFKLQPKKPNWDLKRDLKDRTKILDIRTGNAIAKLVRAKFEAKKKESSDGAEATGIEGDDLVKALHMREREEEEEAQREKQEDRELAEALTTRIPIGFRSEMYDNRDMNGKQVHLDSMVDTPANKRKHDQQSDNDQASKKQRVDQEGPVHDPGNERNHDHPAVCKPCRALKKGCEEIRPCSRCVKSGKPGDCIPSDPKQNRRPRYKDRAEAEKIKSKTGTKSPVPRPPRQEPISRVNRSPALAGTVNQQTVSHPRDPRPRQQNSRPAPSLALSISPNAHFPSTTLPAYSNPMMASSPVSLPRLIRGRGRCVYVLDIRDLISGHDTVSKCATFNQHSLIDLRQRNTPARGYWPLVTMDSEWDEKTKSLPEQVNCVIHIPDTERGDFWGLFAAPVRKMQGQREGTLVVGDPQAGKMLWACISRHLITSIHYNSGLLKLLPRLDTPTFMPGTTGFENWRQAAETWLDGYELPMTEAHICLCRRRKGDCMVLAYGEFAIQREFVKDAEGKYCVQPRMMEEPTMQCQAGDRCPYGHYHFGCLGIPQQKWEGIWSGSEWWCPNCRVKYPDEAVNSVILEGERLESKSVAGTTGISVMEAEAKKKKEKEDTPTRQPSAES
ncbi:hypothetical protein FKW77_008277 [Venturia effusa]|uniref:Zn(2)-C6 fungal-type domain-containing protein n=1 Tax=Venturia effusa TaxID=50376 RepID=A0A517LM05_9PEZI|nr:hypothetical protein FKW77_008277 [Venturia effusa]